MKSRSIKHHTKWLSNVIISVITALLLLAGVLQCAPQIVTANDEDSLNLTRIELPPKGNPYNAADNGEFGFDDLTNGADAIVSGTVIEKNSYWNDKRTGIYTSVVLSVEESFKGTVSQDRITVTYAGGEVDGMWEWVSYMPSFDYGEEAIVFLKKLPETQLPKATDSKLQLPKEQFDVYGGFRGKFTENAGKVDDLPVAEFKERVEQVLEGKVLSVEESEIPSPPATFPYSYAGFCWPHPPSPVVNYRIYENTVDCIGEGAAVQAAAATWSAAGAYFSFSYAGTASTLISGNGINEILWKNLGDVQTIAVTYIWGYETTITECDMEFNDYYLWSTATNPPADRFDTQTTALHEFGHYFCLDDLYDPADSTKVMYGYGDTGEKKRALHADDIAGIRFIYGASTVAPTVINSTGASNIMPTTARLNGEITSTGGENPTVHVYWGDNDGGATSGNWDHDVDLGVKDVGTFYTDISGLTPGTTYYYRCYGINSGGGSWASSTASFDTLITLTMAVSGSGNVTPSIGSHPYALGTTVNITATAATNWEFGYWYTTGVMGQVGILRPDGPGIETSIDYQCPYSGSHWDKVDDPGPGDDDTYLENRNGPPGLEQRDLFTIPDVTSSMRDEAVSSLSIYIWTKFNTPSVKASFRTHGETFNSPELSIELFEPTVDPIVYYTWYLNPFTGDTWTWQEIDDLEIGVVLPGIATGTDWAYCTQLYAEVASVPPLVADPNSATTSVTMNDSCDVIANFVRTHGTLTMAVTGNGTVTPAVGSHTYPIGTSENINATPDAGWRFVNWSGDVGTVADVNLASTNVTINDDYTITANFDRPVLTMAVGGSGDVTPVIGTHVYDLGSTVNITATPAAGWTFVEWTGGVSDNASASTNVTMDTDKTVTAHFSQWLEGAWLIETVDSDGIVGNYNSLALDIFGYPYISYEDGTNGTLKLAYWDGSSWHFEITDNTSDYVGFNSIALDSSDNPKISYYDWILHDLKYASCNGTGWSIEVVDSADDVGRFTSLALDSDEYPCISYHDSTNGDLKYAHWDGSAWQIEVVDSTDNVGGDSSLSLDSSGYPHISYRDLTNQRLKYAFWDGATWQIETIDNGGTDTSLVLDASDKPHISYYDETSTQLKYAYHDGSTWHIETVISEEGHNTSLALDSYGYPHISYEYHPTMDLNYARWDGYAWQINTIDSTDNVGFCISLVLDGLDNPHISYFDFTNSDLKYAHIGCTLTMAVSGSGNVIPVIGDHTYPINDVVDITAIPSGGYRFVNWTGNVSTLANVNAASTNITMDGDYTVTANFAVIPQSSGGGGGGGGATGVTSVAALATGSGKFVEDVTAESADSKVKISIPKNTIGKNMAGRRLSFIFIKPQKTPPAPPADSTIIGLVYDVGPNGSTFDPPITLTILYKDTDLPAGTSESSLFIAIWDANTGTYTRVDCQVDTQANKISTLISHFSQYTILSAPRPAEFTLSDLLINPATVNKGDTLVISVVVTNTGDVSGNYTCSIMINNISKDSKTFSINANEKATLNFSITAGDDGIYNVSVGNLESTFNVQSTPAFFEISSLEISPAEVDIGEKAGISVTVTNKGQTNGIYEINLNVNGSILDKKEVSLSGGESQQVDFTFTADTAGKKIIDVNGTIGGLIVRGEVPPPVQIPLPMEELQPAPEVTTPAESESTLPADQGTTSGTNWLLIAGIPCGCLGLAACVLYFTLWRRRVKIQIKNILSKTNP